MSDIIEQLSQLIQGVGRTVRRFAANSGDGVAGAVLQLQGPHRKRVPSGALGVGAHGEAGRQVPILAQICTCLGIFMNYYLIANMPYKYKSSIFAYTSHCIA